MVKARREKNIIKEEIHITGFELCIEYEYFGLVKRFIFIDCPEDEKGLLFPKEDSVYRIRAAA